MPLQPISKLTTTAIIAATLVACGSDSDSDNKSQAINLDFAAQLNSAELQCDLNTETVGSGQTPADIKYFGVYISELEVATANGDFIPVTLNNNSATDAERGISLITFCGTSLTNNQIRGTVAEGDYSRLRFTIGVPEQYNHLDATQTEGILAKEIAMHWNWTAGYKHARMDVAGWNIHLGSTACSGENADAVCANGNRPTYTFEGVDFSAEKVVLDYAALVNNSDITSNTEGTPPGCMSRVDDPECNAVFSALGLNLASGQCNNNDCDSQSWIRVEAK